MDPAKVYFFRNFSQLHTALDMLPLPPLNKKEVLVKLHMGEAGNKNFIPPEQVAEVVRYLRGLGAEPFLYDTTVAYSSPRATKTGYLLLAAKHGFTKRRVGCDVFVDDEAIPVTFLGREYLVGKRVLETEALFILSHVKGHIETGFGGAIKNMGMGFMSRKTKKAIHSWTKPVHDPSKCTLCGLCAEACPFNAITVEGKWTRDRHKCFGCDVCTDTCPTGALRYRDLGLQEALAHASKAALGDREAVFLNALINIARSCDCDPHAGEPLIPDIGYLVSLDPVAIDQASLDLVHEAAGDLFKRVTGVNPEKQIIHAERLGLGQRNYQLVEM